MATAGSNLGLSRRDPARGRQRHTGGLPITLTHLVARLLVLPVRGEAALLGVRRAEVVEGGPLTGATKVATE